MSEFFKQVDIFKGLSEHDIFDVLQIAKKRTFNPEQLIFRQGSNPDGMYIIESGHVNILLRLPGDRELRAATLEKGDIFGELSLLDRNPHSASAKAADEVTLYFIPYQGFDSLIAYFRPGSVKMMRALTLLFCQRIRTVDKRIIEGLKKELHYTQHILPQSIESQFDKTKFKPTTLNISFENMQRLPFFRDFCEQEVELFLQQVQCWHLPAGCLVFDEEHGNHSGFIVTRGAVKVTAQQGDKALRLMLHGPGQICGQVAMVDGGPRTTTAVIKETATLLEIPHEIYNALIQSKSMLSFKVINHVNKSLVRLMRAYNRQLVRLAEERII